MFVAKRSPLDLPRLELHAQLDCGVAAHAPERARARQAGTGSRAVMTLPSTLK